MNPTEVIFAARDRGVRLSVTQDDRLVAKPASQLTLELKEAIRMNKDALLYDVLLADGLRYLNARFIVVEGADLSALDTREDAINDVYLEDWPAFRAAVRRWIQVGLVEIERAKRSAA